jgi:hypothetical protein
MGLHLKPLKLKNGKCPNLNQKEILLKTNRDENTLKNYLLGNMAILFQFLILSKNGKNQHSKSDTYDRFFRDIIKKGGKSVGSIQKEFDKRRKQKEIMKIREETLSRREETLSQRFIELENRENEIVIREETLNRMEERLKNKEKELNRIEQDFETEMQSIGELEEIQEAEKKIDKEEWLEEQRKLQAELFKINKGTEIEEKSENKPDLSADEVKKMKDFIKEREKEINQFKKAIKGLNAVIIKKDGEIEKLKANNPNFTVDLETKELLMVLDELLENLPEEILDRFAKSDRYLLYERVLSKHDI